MDFSKEERALFSLVDSLTASNRRLSKEIAEAIVTNPSFVVLIVATITQPLELLYNPVIQSAVPATLLSLGGAPKNRNSVEQARRLAAILVLLGTTAADKVIDKIFDSKLSCSTDYLIQALARADVPWHHQNLVQLLESDNLESVAAASIVLIEEVLAQFCNENEEDCQEVEGKISWDEYCNTLDYVWNFLDNPEPSTSPENHLCIGWVCAKHQYIQYFSILHSLRDSLSTSDANELDAILFGLDADVFAQKYLENSVSFLWLESFHCVAHALEAISFSVPCIAGGVCEPPTQLDSVVRTGLAAGFTSSWLETLAVFVEVKDTEAFEFAALLAIASAAAVRAFAISFADATSEELDSLAEELALIIVSDEIPSTTRRKEFAIANLLTDDPDLEELILRVAAYEVLLALDAPLPALPGLPLSGAQLEENDLGYAKELLLSKADSAEALVRQVRTFFDAALWNLDKEPEPELSKEFENIFETLIQSDEPALYVAAQQVQHLQRIYQKHPFTPSFEHSHNVFARLVNLNRARSVGQQALPWLAQAWMQPPIASATNIRDAFAVIATSCAFIDPSFVL